MIIYSLVIADAVRVTVVRPVEGSVIFACFGAETCCRSFVEAKGRRKLKVVPLSSMDSSRLILPPILSMIIFDM